MLLAGEAAGAGVEPGLKDEHGGDLIDDSIAADGGVADVVEMAMGLGGGEALVPEVHDEGELCAELFGEGLRLGGLRALVAGHVERVADDGFQHMVFAEDAGDGLHVRAAMGAVEREEGLRGEAERVGEGDADPAVADVEGDDAWGEVALRPRDAFGSMCLFIHI